MPSKMLHKMKIQKNIRVPKEVAEWMDKHPLSNNSLVCYALYLVQQIEDKATQQAEVTLQISSIQNLQQLNQKLPF